MKHAGKYREQIVIQSRSAAEDANWGDTGESWATFATVWANIAAAPKKSGEADRGGVESRNCFEIKMRYLDGMNSQQRIVWRGRQLDIVSITPDLRGVLRLAFFDVDYHRAGAITAGDARRIWDFLSMYGSPDIGAIMVHCDAGRSRSPSVVFAICDGLGLDRSCIEWPTIGEAAIPSHFIYSTVLSAKPA